MAQETRIDFYLRLGFRRIIPISIFIMLVFAGLMALVFGLALSEHVPRGLIIFIIVTLSTLGFLFIVLAIFFRLPKKSPSDVENIQPRPPVPSAGVELANLQGHEHQNEAGNGTTGQEKRVQWALPNFSRLLKPRGVTNPHPVSPYPRPATPEEYPNNGFHPTRLSGGASNTAR